jgi:hypothetical protein
MASFTSATGVAPLGFTLGDALGLPHQSALRRQALRDALRRLEAREEPGNTWEISYPDYTSDRAIANNGAMLQEE